MAVDSGKKWSCSRCTFEQSPYNDECQICGQKNESVKIIDKKEYGSIIYQVDRFTDDQLTATYTLYVENSNIQTSNWSLFLFGDNDIDNSRPPNTDREMIGGLGMFYYYLFR